MNRPTIATTTLPVATPDDEAFFATDRALDPAIRERILIERSIVRRAVTDLIEAGYKVAVDDGEAIAQAKSSDVNAVMAAIMSTDEDVLHVYHTDGVAHNGMAGWISLVYGNDGWDVISDHTVNLSDVLKPVDEYADALCDLIFQAVVSAPKAGSAS